MSYNYKLLYKNAENVTTEIQRDSSCCRHDTADGLLPIGKEWKLNCPCPHLFF